MKPPPIDKRPGCMVCHGRGFVEGPTRRLPCRCLLAGNGERGEEPFLPDEDPQGWNKPRDMPFLGPQGLRRA
jgi:hypothetical protein